MKKLKKFLCNHDYRKIGFHEEEENGVRYSVRTYKCKKCGKEINVDGRKDYVNA
jgi:hypothetical protein